MNSADKIRNRLPAWMSMRFNPDSIGWQLIDIIADNIDELKTKITKVSNWRYLSKLDPHEPNLCYAGHLSRQCLKSDITLQVEAGELQLQQVDSLEDFLDALKYDSVVQDPFYVDFTTGNIYVRSDYGDGQIKVSTVNSANVIIRQFVVSLHPVPLWNAIDEQGLLLGVRRLPGESNDSFLLRIYAASRLPANSTKSGWIRGIARELGLFITLTWRDGRRDFPLPHKYVNRETIMVDYEPVSDEDILVGPDGQIAIKGNFAYTNKQRIVSYAYGIRIHELFDTKDPWVAQTLFDEDGIPTAEAIELKEEIDRKVPVKWDYFVWGDTLWNPGGLGLLPQYYDTCIDGFLTI